MTDMPDVLGILPLRGTVIFPQAVVTLGASRPSSVRLIEEALQGSRIVGAVMQRDAAEDNPGAAGLHAVGTLAIVHKVWKQADGKFRLVVEGLGRFRIVEVLQESPFLRARVERLQREGAASSLEAEALARSASSLLQKVVSPSPTPPDEMANVGATAEGPAAVARPTDASWPPLAPALKQA